MTAEQHRPIVPGDTGWPTRAGEACFFALAVASFSSVPTALRTAGAGGGFLDGMLVGTGVLLPIVLAALSLSRASGRGFRQLVGSGSPHAVVLGMLLWIGLSLPLLVFLGALLKATTHHHGLAGATFGVLGLVIVAFAALLAARLVGFGRRLVERGLRPWIPAAAGALLSVLPLLAVAAPLGSRGGDGSGAQVRASIIDGAILVVATSLAASMHLAPWLRRFARLGGVPLMAVVFVGAGARIESSPALGQAFKAGGGLAATLLGVLERWTDRDGDGMGAHFGGGDCDEGDPRRHPGAPEGPGDGIDQDCDGIDPVKPATDPILVASAAVSATAQATSAKAGAQAQPLAEGPSLAQGASKVAPTPGPPAKPDILLVTLDTVRADHTSAYGYDKPTTPHLTELAARGVLFEHAYATGSDTRRALTPLVSGKWFSETPHDNREWPTILPETDTLAERLKRSGYRTGAVTSFTWLSAERGFSQGFDIFKPVFEQAHPERETTGPLAVKAALSIWKDLEKDSHPIFLWVHLFDAHERYLEHPSIKMGKGKMGAYDGEVAFVDKQLGELLRGIGASPRAAKVAWIVHGSQGEAFGEHGASGHGAELYDEVLRVPLLVALPSEGDPKAIHPRRYAESAVSTLDIAPSVSALAGAEGEGLLGHSLLSIPRAIPRATPEGDVSQKHGPVYARTQKKVALIDWPLKIIVTERKKTDRILLFDLSKDPAEKEDISKARAEDAERLLKLRTTFETH